MKFTPSRIKQIALSDSEQQALRGIADRVPVPAPLTLRLEKFGLVEKSGDGWAVTEQGHIRLMFQGAR
jgi:hypothetical protein